MSRLLLRQFKLRKKYENMRRARLWYDKVYGPARLARLSVFRQWSYFVSSYFVRHGMRAPVFRILERVFDRLLWAIRKQPTLRWLVALEESHRRPSFIYDSLRKRVETSYEERLQRWARKLRRRLNRRKRRTNRLRQKFLEPKPYREKRQWVWAKRGRFRVLQSHHRPIPFDYVAHRGVCEHWDQLDRQFFRGSYLKKCRSRLRALFGSRDQQTFRWKRAGPSLRYQKQSSAIQRALHGFYHKNRAKRRRLGKKFFALGRKLSYKLGPRTGKNQKKKFCKVVVLKSQLNPGVGFSFFVTRGVPGVVKTWQLPKQRKNFFNSLFGWKTPFERAASSKQLVKREHPPRKEILSTSRFYWFICQQHRRSVTRHVRLLRHRKVLWRYLAKKKIKQRRPRVSRQSMRRWKISLPKFPQIYQYHGDLGITVARLGQWKRSTAIGVQPSSFKTNAQKLNSRLFPRRQKAAVASMGRVLQNDLDPTPGPTKANQTTTKTTAQGLKLDIQKKKSFQRRLWFLRLRGQLLTRVENKNFVWPVLFRRRRNRRRRRVRYKVLQFRTMEEIDEERLQEKRWLLLERHYYRRRSPRSVLKDMFLLLTPRVHVLIRAGGRGSMRSVRYAVKADSTFAERRRLIFNWLQELVNKNPETNHLIRNTARKPNPKVRWELRPYPKRRRRLTTSFPFRLTREFSKILTMDDDFQDRLNEHQVHCRRLGQVLGHFRWTTGTEKE